MGHVLARPLLVRPFAWLTARPRQRRSFSFRCASCRAQRKPCPTGEFVGIVVQAIRHLPIRSHDQPIALGDISEGPQALALEVRDCVLVRLEMNDTAGHEREHRIIGIDAQTAEHTADPNRPDAREQLNDVIGVH